MNTLEEMRNELNFMDSVLEAFETINRISGDGAQVRKIALVSGLKTTAQMYGQERTLRNVILAGFDPLSTTHISTVAYDKSEVVTLNENVDFNTLFEDLRKVKAVNNELRQRVVDYVNSFRLELRPMMTKVFTKGMNIGMGASLINKAIGEKWVFDKEIMKAEVGLGTVQKWLVEDGGCFAEMKYDGVRGFAEMKNGECVGIKTYNFSELDLSKMTRIPAQLEELARVWSGNSGEQHFFFDFEITGPQRQKVSGEITKLLKGTAPIGCDTKWLANIFDAVPWSIFDGVPFSDSYIKRRDILINSFRELDAENLTLAKAWRITTMEELDELFCVMLSDGQEGLVVKKASGIYELKRSAYWIKMKAEKECDLEIISWYKGNGKREGKIGGFTCATSDRKLVVSVGSGFSDWLIDEITDNDPDNYIGKIIKVRYNTVIDKQDSDILSLFLPRFVEFRMDKSEANDVNYVKKK